MRRDPVGYAKSIGVQVGNNCRLLGLQAGTFGSEPYLVQLGNHVTVTSGVKFLTHDGGVWVFRNTNPDIEVLAPITIGNNVFIGINSIILPGVTIGDNCVIGAGAVVTRDIQGGHVAVGCPARCIRTLDAYYNNVKPRATFTRSLSEPAKREYFKKKFGL